MPAGRRSWADFPTRPIIKESVLEQTARQFFEQDHQHTSWDEAPLTERVKYRDQARDQLEAQRRRDHA